MTAGLPEKVVETATGETVVGRLGEPEDCAAAVAFLCSEQARHVTGQVVKVDGGQHL
jgi:3-oxoacyl-[acyl-carrier protein] reductase